MALGRPLLVRFSIFYLIRIIAEFIFFGFGGLRSVVIVAPCLIPALIYLWTALVRPREFAPAR